MIDPLQFRTEIIRPTIERLGMGGRSAELLLLGTALVESNLSALKQYGGEALGVYQIEPETHDDLSRYLDSKPTLRVKVSFLSTAGAVFPFDRQLVGFPFDKQLVGNLYYATAMARVKYWMIPAALPDDIQGWAAYWKRYYNTAQGKGDPAEFVRRLEPFMDEVG